MRWPQGQAEAPSQVVSSARVQDSSTSAPADAAPKLLLGAGLLALVLVLLGIPMLLAVRGARQRRRRVGTGTPSKDRPVDAWAESARRMGGGV